MSLTDKQIEELERELRDAYDARRADAYEANDSINWKAWLLKLRIAQTLVSAREYNSLVNNSETNLTPNPDPDPTPDPDPPISEDSIVIKVDNNDGLQSAIDQLRDGYPDQLLLKRGQIYRGGLGHWKKSGRSISEPMIIGAYGEGTNPKFYTDGRGLINSSGDSEVSNLIIRDIDAYANQRDPDSADFIDGRSSEVGIWWMRKSSNINFKNITLEFFSNAMNVGQRLEYDVRNITLDSCRLLNSYLPWDKGHSQGMFADRIVGLNIYNCSFDHNGWNEDVDRAKRTGFNHNAYIYQCSNVDIKNSKFYRGSNMGVKVAADENNRTTNIDIDKCLFAGNLTGIKFSGDDRDKENLVVKNVNVTNSVVTHNGGPLNSQTKLGNAIVLSQVDNATINSNFFIDKVANTNWYAINVDTWRPNGNVAIKNNVVERWYADEPLINDGGAELSGVSLENNSVEQNIIKKTLAEYTNNDIYDISTDPDEFIDWLKE